MILALDLATQSGWCAGMPGGPIEYNSFRVGRIGCSLGAFLGAYNAELGALLERLQPSRIVYEAPLLRLGAKSKGQTSMDVARKLIGLANHTDFVADARHIACFQSSPSDVAEYFIGRNRWSGGRAEKKARTIEACQALGHTPPDDNAADAIALWCFAVWRFFPKLAPRRWDGPLLGVAASLAPGVSSTASGRREDPPVPRGERASRRATP